MIAIKLTLGKWKSSPSTNVMACLPGLSKLYRLLSSEVRRLPVVDFPVPEGPLIKIISGKEVDDVVDIVWYIGVDGRL